MTPLVAYVAERFPARVFGPALVALVTLGWSTMNEPAAADLARSAVVASLLLVQLRLLDDLQDVERDRLTHPERVLVRSPQTSFRVAERLLMLAPGPLLIDRPWALASLCALHLTSAIAYRAVRPHVTDVTWRYGLLLLKYPALVAVIALSARAFDPLRLLTAVMAAYAGAAAYERWHSDRTAGLQPGMQEPHA